MALFTIGINHHTAPLAIRERVAFGPETLLQALHQLTRDKPVQEAAILSTCNRTELYCATETPEAVVDWLAEHHQLSKADIEPFLYVLPADEAVRHTFRVASGLDSMVVGETQILGQMRDAVRSAEAAGTLGSLLHKLFQRSFSVAKDVRTTTAIGANTVSMAAAGVHLAERIFPSISDQKILFIGAGEMIELCLTHFAARSPKHITIANRTIERGQALAERFNAQSVHCVRLEMVADILPQFDIVVSCTASPLPILGLGMVERAVKTRRHRPMFMVDLAVPRDIEAEVGNLDDVFLYTVDDLAQVVASGMESRQAAVVEAEELVTGGVNQFMHWLDSRGTVPVIRALRDTAERHRRHELEHAQKLLANGTPPEQVIEQLAQRLTNKFLHTPTQALNQAEGDERNQLNLAANRLFNLHTKD
ncbi:MAG: hypothetical protein RIR18_194 [Pseudomonadota bacterium]|jgi:glutamyl-tRNA reductase